MTREQLEREIDELGDALDAHRVMDNATIEGADIKQVCENIDRQIQLLSQWLSKSSTLAMMAVNDDDPAARQMGQFALLQMIQQTGPLLMIAEIGRQLRGEETP